MSRLGLGRNLTHPLFLSEECHQKGSGRLQTGANSFSRGLWQSEERIICSSISFRDRSFGRAQTDWTEATEKGCLPYKPPNPMT